MHSICEWREMVRTINKKKVHLLDSLPNCLMVTPKTGDNFDIIGPLIRGKIRRFLHRTHLK